jgi:hypothetical protein
VIHRVTTARPVLCSASSTDRPRSNVPHPHGGSGPTFTVDCGCSIGPAGRHSNRPGRLLGRPGAFNSSCPSRICPQQAIACEMVGGGPTVAPMMLSRASRNFAFEPAQFRAMHEAFDAVCVKLRLSTASEDKLTELVGEKVIELAMAGERNAETLTVRTLAEFGVGNDGSLWRH